jgi:hypothetical protein
MQLMCVLSRRFIGHDIVHRIRWHSVNDSSRRRRLLVAPSTRLHVYAKTLLRCDVMLGLLVSGQCVGRAVLGDAPTLADVHSSDRSAQRACSSSPSAASQTYHS